MENYFITSRGDYLPFIGDSIIINDDDSYIIQILTPEGVESLYNIVEKKDKERFIKEYFKWLEKEVDK